MLIGWVYFKSWTLPLHALFSHSSSPQACTCVFLSVVNSYSRFCCVSCDLFAHLVISMVLRLHRLSRLPFLGSGPWTRFLHNHPHSICQATNFYTYHWLWLVSFFPSGHLFLWTRGLDLDRWAPRISGVPSNSGDVPNHVYGWALHWHSSLIVLHGWDLVSCLGPLFSLDCCPHFGPLEVARHGPQSLCWWISDWPDQSLDPHSVSKTLAFGSCLSLLSHGK